MTNLNARGIKVDRDTRASVLGCIAFETDYCRFCRKRVRVHIEVARHGPAVYTLCGECGERIGKDGV